MKKWLVRVVYKAKEDLILVVKTKDIEKYMNDFVKDILDLINGYEYEELRTPKRNDCFILCGAYSGVDFIKAVLNHKES